MTIFHDTMFLDPLQNVLQLLLSLKVNVFSVVLIIPISEKKNSSHKMTSFAVFHVSVELQFEGVSGQFKVIITNTSPTQTGGVTMCKDQQRCHV